MSLPVQASGVVPPDFLGCIISCPRIIYTACLAGLWQDPDCPLRPCDNRESKVLGGNGS